MLFCSLLLSGVGQAQSVGIIGSATPGGWDADTDLVKDAADPNLWKANVTLVDGEAKFRANDAWTLVRLGP